MTRPRGVAARAVAARAEGTAELSPDHLPAPGKTPGTLRKLPKTPGRVRRCPETPGRLRGAATGDSRRLGGLPETPGRLRVIPRLQGHSETRMTRKTPWRLRNAPTLPETPGRLRVAPRLQGHSGPRKTPRRLRTAPRLQETPGCPESPQRLRNAALEKTPGTLGHVPNTPRTLFQRFSKDSRETPGDTTWYRVSQECPERPHFPECPWSLGK